MAIEYTKEIYNKVVAQKLENEQAINDLYSDFNNLNQEEKFAALSIITNLEIINEEFNKYVAVYNAIVQDDKRSDEYIVITGDTIYSIAQKITGDYNNWKNILRFNKLSDIELEIGTVISIPQNI